MPSHLWGKKKAFKPPPFERKRLYTCNFCSAPFEQDVGGQIQRGFTTLLHRFLLAIISELVCQREVMIFATWNHGLSYSKFSRLPLWIDQYETAGVCVCVRACLLTLSPARETNVFTPLSLDGRWNNYVSLRSRRQRHLFFKMRPCDVLLCADEMLFNAINPSKLISRHFIFFIRGFLVSTVLKRGQYWAHQLMTAAQCHWLHHLL